MTAKGDGALLCRGDEAASDAGAPQLGMNPEQIDKQPAGIKMPDQTGLDGARVVAHEQPEIVIAIVAQKRRVVIAEPLVDKLAIRRRRVLFDAEAATGRQIHAELPGEGWGGSVS